MAEQGPRSIANIVFVLLLALALAGAGYLTYEMLGDAFVRPG